MRINIEPLQGSDTFPVSFPRVAPVAIQIKPFQGSVNISKSITSMHRVEPGVNLQGTIIRVNLPAGRQVSLANKKLNKPVDYIL
jgi:hypothetical protein